MKRTFFILCTCICVHTILFAYNPPAGGESAHTFFSPDLLGGQVSVTGGPFGDTAPAAAAANPAVSAYEQRIIFDLSYALLAGFNKYPLGDKGVKGHLANLDFLYPARWGVIATDVHFFYSAFPSLPWGSAGSLRFSYSKDLTEKLAIGTGLYGIFGSGWGLGADIGILYRFGDLGVAKDSKLGFSLTGMGKPYNPKLSGVKGTQKVSGFPALFTPRVGFATTFVAVKNFKLGMNFDLSLPTFQNLVFDTGLHMMFGEMVTFKTGWNFNLVETLHRRQTYIPSFGLAVAIKINSKDKSESNVWEQSDITPQFGVKPFYNNIWAFGAGVNVRVGRTDTAAPVISVTYPETQYISPNSDGTQDVLELPLSITDQRYVVAWECSIENENGEVVRTIANKQALQQLDSGKSFWALLTRVKEGVEVPEQLRWDGMLDSGSVAPDGTYYFTITASDDNKNTAKTERYAVVVDNTAPVISLTPPTGQNALIFSPDGDGNKDNFLIKQNGSVEDEWRAEVINTAQQTVRTAKTKNRAPADFVWDGKTDSGDFTADGIYTYRISATDRAGNTAAASVQNIIVDTVKPSVAISINTNAFSPNGDGVKDTITLLPAIPVQTGLQEWKIDIQNTQGASLHTVTGDTVGSISFDGKDKNGKLLPEGNYRAVLSARYSNGYAPSETSPVFTLDITAPKGSAKGSTAIFSPDGDGALDTVAFSQQISAGDTWNAEIYALDSDGAISGKPIRSFAVTKDNSAGFAWDGRTNAGTLAAAGKYGYRLVGKDDAGNTGYSVPAGVELNTEKADVILSANMLAFSPNKDGVQDSIVFTPTMKSSTAVDSYTFGIYDPAGTAVKTLTGSGTPPASINWDGTADSGDQKGNLCADGVYSASIDVVLKNGQSAKSAVRGITLDTQYPVMEISVPYTVFSTDAAASRPNLPVSQKGSHENLWTGTVTAADNKTVRTFKWEGEPLDFTWDGTDDSGNKVSDGTYRYSIAAQDEAGNKTSRFVEKIVIDSRVPKAYITAELAAISPNGDGVKDVQNLTVHTTLKDGLAEWAVSIKSAESSDSVPVKVWSAAKGDTLAPLMQWNGKSDAGKIENGTFIAELYLRYTKGDELTVSSAPFVSSTKAPELGVKLLPKYFSPDNDGNEDELFINLFAKSDTQFKQWSFEIREPEDTGNKLFWSTGGKDKITEQIIWDGRSLKGETVQSATDYPYTFTVTDEIGLTSVVKGYIPIDVLVIRDGDKLKIAVPSIIFRKNAADFEGLDKAVVDKNIKVLTRIAEILNKFPEYKIQVEGHANNTSGTEREEREDLIPLSTARADAVRKFLIEKGVFRGRLSAVGIGGTKPIASLSDRDNWWKNRRVEFILIK
ncbi:MAG: FlgD immunoglobulin-like domain containing protein [Treponema sp.]